MTDLTTVLREERSRIVSRFVFEIEQKNLSPAGVSRPLLVDHIPRFLDEVIAELDRARALRLSQDVVDTSEVAREHGEQRWNLGYDLEALVREYGVLRHCILDAVKEKGAQLSIDEFDMLAKCLSVGVAEAVVAYSRYRDQELDAQKARLEFLAEAGELLASSLDYRSTLNRLTGLVVPRLSDWCAVHLDGCSVDEMPLAHADPTKLEVLREIYRRYPPARDAPQGHPRVLQSGEPEVVPEVFPGAGEGAAQSPEDLALLRSIGTCSWMVVPLGVQGSFFGALTLAYSDSRRSYGKHDLVLACDLARRAAVAIDNARLYDLSQKERSRVEAAIRAKDEFVAMVSHELRTPLNAILGWLKVMRMGIVSDAKREHAFDVIERNALAQNQLVGDLLDISRIITGKVRLNSSQVDLRNVIEMALEAVLPAAEAKGIEISLDLDRQDAVLRGDGDRLQQVAWNLLANAVKFTPKQGRVGVRLRRINSDVELSVQDSGEGITSAFLPYVFESFRQSETGTSRAHGGLGIGLSITKHLVELHGGSIEAHSPGPGQGATFVVRLPISPLVSTTLGVHRMPATRPAGPVETTGLAGGEGIRALVVDDEPDARDLVRYVLESSGMEVQSAGSVAEALQALETYRPHVVISDIGMPNEDGYSLIRSIRTDPSDDLKNLSAIALTAFARNEDRTRALVEGFNVHMAKPVEPSALVAAVVELAGHVRR